jgi:hypothetical protein
VPTVHSVGQRMIYTSGTTPASKFSSEKRSLDRAVQLNRDG